MNPLNGTTYSADPVEHLETIVGDEMQTEALPRVKIKGWDNEVNLSVGVIYDETPQTMTLEGDKVIWEQGDVTASFEPLVQTITPDTHISLIDEGQISPQRIAAEYEVDRYFDWGQTVRIHQPNVKSMMYYGFYNAEEFIDRTLLDIPEVRLSATNWNDPMTMDNQLVMIDVQYNETRDDTEKIHTSTITAIKEVLARYGVEAYHTTHTYKLYFKDGDKDVKFFSTGFFQGHYYYYINLGHDYNGALNYFKDPNAKPRSDANAYGLRAIADIPVTIGSEIITRYAELYGLPLLPRIFTTAEEAKIIEIEQAHANEDWIVRGKRSDVWRLTADEQNENGFEFDVTLATQPASNVYTMSIQTKDLEFCKQEAVADDKLKEEYRSPRVVGSYAVYHDSKQGNGYKSGKAFHIYRPIIRDANGWEVWGDLEIDTEMRITIPQDFIDTAVYPIIIDPTFGYTTTGASTVVLTSLIVASDATLNAAGNLVMINGKIGAPQATDSAQSAVYDASGVLLYTSSTVGANIETTYYSAKPTLQAATYRIAFKATPTLTYSPTFLYDSVAGTSYSLSTTGAFPADMSGFTTEATRRYTIWGVTGYQWPIMVGNSTILAATVVSTGLDIGSATAWTATGGNQDIIMPTATALHDFKFSLTTAPGVGATRRMSINSIQLYVDIADTATSAENTTTVYYPAAGVAGAVTHSPTVGTPATSTVNKWRAAATGDYQGWYSTSVALLSTTLTRYMGMQDGSGVSTTAAAATSTMPNDAGTIMSARCSLLGGGITAGSYTVTLYKGGSPTGLSMTITGTTASTATTVSVTGTTPASADTLYWEIVPSAGTAPSNARRIAISVEYASNTAGNGISFGGNSTNIAGTQYSSAYDAWNATEINIQGLAYVHTMKALRIDLSAAPVSPTSRTVALRINGANPASPPSVTISTTATSGTWSGTQAIATDDLVDFIHTIAGGTPAASNVKWSYVFSAPAFAAASTIRILAMTGVGK